MLSSAYPESRTLQGLRFCQPGAAQKAVGEQGQDRWPKVAKGISIAEDLIPSIINWGELADRGWLLLMDGLGITQWGGEQLCNIFLGFLSFSCYVVSLFLVMFCYSLFQLLNCYFTNFTEGFTFFPLILLPFSWAREGVSKLWWLDDWLGLVKPQYCFKSSLIPKCLTWATVAVLNCPLGPISLVKDFPDVGTGTQRWKGETGLGKKCSLGLLDGRVWLLWWEMPLCSVVTCCHSVTRLLQWQIAPQLLRDHYGWMNNILELANLFEGAFVVP